MSTTREWIMKYPVVLMAPLTAEMMEPMVAGGVDRVASTVRSNGYTPQPDSARCVWHFLPCRLQHVVGHVHDRGCEHWALSVAVQGRQP